MPLFKSKKQEYLVLGIIYIAAGILLSFGYWSYYNNAEVSKLRLFFRGLIAAYCLIKGVLFLRQYKKTMKDEA